jgi:isoquinoline 1-oxidoreductase beta subunit
MIIADEIGLALHQVDVSLRDADPKLLYNQLTGGSNSTHSLYATVRQAAATARGQLQKTAAAKFGGQASAWTISGGVAHGPGASIRIGELTRDAAVSRTQPVQAELRPDAKLVGTGQGRVDALAAVTGKKVFAMDVDLPGAVPTIVCRPPTINGSVRSVRNLAAVEAMPGVEHVVVVPREKFIVGGVAVCARTFGQCIDAVRALQVDWGPGTVDDKSDADVLADLRKNELPLTPAVPGAKVIEQAFTFHFRPGDPLETNCATADVRKDGTAEIWASLKSPIWAKQQIAGYLGYDVNKVAVHVAQGGGSFGRHLFCDAAFEAAIVSQKIGRPVKLMWHRTDNFRQGRVHPMNTSRVRVAYSGQNVLAYDQRHTSVATDFTQGLGEVYSANAATVPGGNLLGFSEGIFTLTANVPYNFGTVTQLLNEIYAYDTFNTSSVRNVYSPDLCTATELMVDQVAKAMGSDPLAFRKAFVKDARMLAVLNELGQAGNWGRSMPAGTAQGIGIHHEYKGFNAVLCEIDCRPATVNRFVENGYTGPRVTKLVMVVDVGLPINLLGLEAQMQGGMMDGLAQALTYGLHLERGVFQEASWDNAYYTRQWNVPPEMEVHIMPASQSVPGGAGEFAVGTTMAAVACAYARATGTVPTEFPINWSKALSTFTPYPTVPPIPPSPTNGLTTP